MDYINESNQLRELIRQLEKKLSVLQEKQLSCCEESMTQCHALVEIGRAKSISLNELADKLNLESSTVSRTVNKLVTNELVKRDLDPDDRRYVTISLTESGNKNYINIETNMDFYFKNIYTLIPESKRNQVVESLKILIDAIAQQ
jgi:DNA-binding MarR family transcriptional regulator